MEAFRNDELAKKAGFIVARGLSGLIYECSLHGYSSVYIEQLNGKWYRSETYQKGRSEAIYVKAIESGNEFEYVLLKAKKYIKLVQSKTNY